MLHLISACASSPQVGAASGSTAPVEVTQMPMEAVFSVSWETAEEGQSAVVCADGVSPEKETQAVDAPVGDTHTVLLASLGERTTWTCTASTGSWTSDAFTITTPEAPSSVPNVNVTVAAADDLTGFALVPSLNGGWSSVTLVDREGRHTWWYVGEPDDAFLQAWMAPDGRSVMFMSMSGLAAVHRVSLDGATHEIFPIPGLTHGFHPLDNGGFVAILEDIRDVTVADHTWSVVGNALVEFDADGAPVREIWNSWDTVALDTSRLPADVPTYDWTHVNSVTPAADGTWLLSLWMPGLVLLVDDADGSLVWTLGDNMEFVYQGEGLPFDGQHGVELDGNTVRLFNNRSQEVEDPAELWSEAVEFELDLDAGTFQRTWSYNADKSVFTPALGDVEVRADGHRVIGWATAGRIQELDADDNTVWQLDADLGGAFGYTHIVENLAGATR